MNRFFLPLLFVCFISSPLKAGTDHKFEHVIETTEIIDLTLDATLSCLGFEVTGVCVWMTCFLFACEFNTSIKVKNFVPDLLVQVYNRDQGEPWEDSQIYIEMLNMDQDSGYIHSIMNAAGKLMSNDYKVPDSDDISGGVRTTATNKHKSSLSFYYVDIFGNPALLAFDNLAEAMSGYVCTSATDPYALHYNSNLDIAAWRWNFPELFYPQSWLVGLDALGGASNNWGSIYPRMGFSVHQDALKSAVLKAFRATHFVTGNEAARIFFELDHSSTQGYWPSGPLDQNDSDTGLWQMLYPHKDDSCQQFPYSDSSTHDSRRSDDANYVWNFWKAYKCCEKEGAVLIFHTG